MQYNNTKQIFQILILQIVCILVIGCHIIADEHIVLLDIDNARIGRGVLPGLRTKLLAQIVVIVFVVVLDKYRVDLTLIGCTDLEPCDVRPAVMMLVMLVEALHIYNALGVGARLAYRLNTAR